MAYAHEIALTTEAHMIHHFTEDYYQLQGLLFILYLKSLTEHSKAELTNFLSIPVTSTRNE